MIEKKCLKDAGEVIKYLKEGYVLKVEDGGEGIIYMQDGFIVKKNNSGYHINYTINECDKPYYFLENPLKIEIGKFYKTRDGRKAYCFNFKKEKGLEDSFFDFVIDNYGGFSTKFNGKVFFTDNNDDVLDIVDYWEEK